MTNEGSASTGTARTKVLSVAASAASERVPEQYTLAETSAGAISLEAQ